MATGFAGGLAKGLKDREDRKLVEEQQRAQQEIAQKKALQDSVASAAQNISAVQEKAFSMASTINKSLVDLAMSGELDPVTAAHFRQSRDATIARAVETMGAARAGLAEIPGVDPAMMASIPDLTEFFDAQRSAYDAEIIAGFAQAPKVQERNALMAKIEAAEIALGLEKGTLPPNYIKAIAGFRFDPRMQNFISPDGTRTVMLDMTGPNAAAEADKLRRMEYTAYGQAVQASEVGGLRLGLNEMGDWTAMAANTQSLLEATRAIRMQVAEGDSIFTGLAGKAVGGIVGMVSQVEQFGKLLGGEDEDGLWVGNKIDISQLDFGETFDNLAKSDPELVQSARATDAYRFSLASLAYMIQRSRDPGGRIGFQEIQQVLKEIGTGNLKTVGAVLDQVDRMGIGRLSAMQENLALRQDVRLPPKMQQLVDNYRKQYGLGSGEEQPSTPSPNQAETPKGKALMDQLRANPSLVRNKDWRNALGALSEEERNKYKDEIQSIINEGNQ